MTTAELTEREAERRTSASEDRRPQAPTFRRVLLAVLVALTAVGLVGLVWVVSSRGVGAAGVQGDQAKVQADREAVMAQTQTFMVRMGTYGPQLLDDKGGMPEYRSRVKAVITPKFAVSFD